MKKKKKYIRTKEIKNLELLDKCVLLVPPAICIRFLNFSSIVANFKESFATGLFTLVAFSIILAIFYIPVMMIWRSASKTLYKNAIRKSTFLPLTDIDYYRDELTGISPALISMCTDLEIEIQKDITAQILKYTMDNQVSIENNTVTVLVDDFTGFSASDTFLLKTLKKNDLTPVTSKQWKEIVKDEIIDHTYIKTKKLPKKYKSKGCVTYFLGFILTWAGIAYFITSEHVDRFLQLEGTSNEEALQLIIREPFYILIMLGIIICGIAAFITLLYPIAAIIKGVIIVKTAITLERTEKGEALSEKIYGLKNFIHDFSDLENADKEKLVLWDDFLIYAVVLEENSSIIEEILGMRNIKLTNVNI